jgi:hypothetical protein
MNARHITVVASPFVHIGARAHRHRIAALAVPGT